MAHVLRALVRARYAAPAAALIGVCAWGATQSRESASVGINPSAMAPLWTATAQTEAQPADVTRLKDLDAAILSAIRGCGKADERRKVVELLFRRANEFRELDKVSGGAEPSALTPWVKNAGTIAAAVKSACQHVKEVNDLLKGDGTLAVELVDAIQRAVPDFMDKFGPIAKNVPIIGVAMSLLQSLTDKYGRVQGMKSEYAEALQAAVDCSGTVAQLLEKRAQLADPGIVDAALAEYSRAIGMIIPFYGDYIKQSGTTAWLRESHNKARLAEVRAAMEKSRANLMLVSVVDTNTMVSNVEARFNDLTDKVGSIKSTTEATREDVAELRKQETLRDSASKAYFNFTQAWSGCDGLYPAGPSRPQSGLNAAMARAVMAKDDPNAKALDLARRRGREFLDAYAECLNRPSGVVQDYLNKKGHAEAQNVVSYIGPLDALNGKQNLTGAAAVLKDLPLDNWGAVLLTMIAVEDDINLNVLRLCFSDLPGDPFGEKDAATLRAAVLEYLEGEGKPVVDAMGPVIQGYAQVAVKMVKRGSWIN
eukprot:m.100281 g.100281  ORF g.100281 m.100281 type:complete len:537 (-) comp8746_c1_seq1:61-1671(-)